MPETNLHLAHFTVAGINYRKSDVQIRGRFSITSEQSQQVLEQAADRFHGCFLLSTCNRTEIYGVSNDPNAFVDLLCIYTHGNNADFKKHGYIKQGLSAVEHLFKVSSGLDSQIVGDYEILSQVKKAANLSKMNNCMTGFLEKVVNYSLQASKEIKTKTRLSSGTVSVSYAAIEIIKEKAADYQDKKILVIGAGKFGYQVGKNLKTYLPGCTLFFCNRTDEKASSLARECNAGFIKYDHLPEFADTADIIVVSSAAENYTVIPSFFKTPKERLILDLSIPQNVDPAVSQIKGVDLMNVDEISILLDKTMTARSAEIPKALLIVKDTLQQLVDWCGMQGTNRFLRTVKLQLNSLSENPSLKANSERIHRTVSTLALQLRTQNNKGCQCIHAINNYLQMNYEEAC